MKWLGRSPSKPPPRVAKSAGTASGANTARSNSSRIAMLSGTASVQATSARIQGLAISRPLKAAGTCCIGCVSGATSASPATRPGCRCANVSATAPPSE